MEYFAQALHFSIKTTLIAIVFFIFRSGSGSIIGSIVTAFLQPMSSVLNSTSLIHRHWLRFLTWPLLCLVSSLFIFFCLYFVLEINGYIGDLDIITVIAVVILLLELFLRLCQQTSFIIPVARLVGVAIASISVDIIYDVAYKGLRNVDMQAFFNNFISQFKKMLFL